MCGDAPAHRLRHVAIYVRIEEFRTRRGWSQAQLARESGVNQSTISRAESGETLAMSIHSLHLIAKALEIPAAALIHETEE